LEPRQVSKVKDAPQSPIPTIRGVCALLLDSRKYKHLAGRSHARHDVGESQQRARSPEDPAGIPLPNQLPAGPRPVTRPGARRLMAQSSTNP
jgi:hypothetical protein